MVRRCSSRVTGSTFCTAILRNFQRFDSSPYQRDNDRVRRRLLALLFCLTACVALAHLSAALVDDPPGTPQLSAIDAGAPDEPSDSEGRWNAGYRVSLSSAASLWKSGAVHADLATAPVREPFVVTVAARPRDRIAPDRPAHLLHTPLLI
jgi:hypothetical protein